MHVPTFTVRYRPASPTQLRNQFSFRSCHTFSSIAVCFILAFTVFNIRLNMIMETVPHITHSTIYIIYSHWVPCWHKASSNEQTSEGGISGAGTSERVVNTFHYRQCKRIENYIVSDHLVHVAKLDCLQFSERKSQKNKTQRQTRQKRKT